MLGMEKNTLAAIGATILPNLGGWAGAMITRNNMTWYEGLNKPNWRPPNAAFGPVWTTLYSGMGYASYLVYQTGQGFQGPAKLPLMLYGSQLALNWAWTPVFFGLRSPKWGLVTIGALYVNAGLCGFYFYQINKTAGWLFVPYMMWLTLATALNYVVYRDNREEQTSTTVQSKKD